MSKQTPEDPPDFMKKYGRVEFNNISSAEARTFLLPLFIKKLVLVFLSTSINYSLI